VTVSAGVPTVWLGILQVLQEDGGDLGPLERIICGGSAAPVSMIRTFEQRYGVIHAYGMIESCYTKHPLLRRLLPLRLPLGGGVRSATTATSPTDGRALTEQAEVAYRQLVAGWQPKRPATKPR